MLVLLRNYLVEVSSGVNLYLKESLVWGEPLPGHSKVAHYGNTPPLSRPVTHTPHLLTSIKLRLTTYSWNGRPVRTQKKTICRDTKRATTDLNIWMKSSRRGAFNGEG